MSERLVNENRAYQFAQQFQCPDKSSLALANYVCALEDAIEKLHARLNHLEQQHANLEKRYYADPAHQPMETGCR